MRRVRSLAALAVAAVVGASVPLVPAGAPPAVAATGSGACASHLVPATRFVDTLTTVHRAAIDCAVWWELVQGTTTTRFAPDADVTRGQTAAMLARLLRTTGHAPSSAPSAGFTDTVGHTFERDIDLLSSLDIVSGASATRFEPDRPVNRAQMATMIVRTFAYGYGDPLPDGPMPFVDVSPASVHHDAIASLTAAKITGGVTATTYEPGTFVPRAQMASFVTRSAGVLLARGLAQRPTARPAANDAYASRMRGAWIHLFDGTLKTRSNIRAMVDELAAADANVIVAQVARRHDAYYRSSVLPRTPDPAVASDLDVLAEVITAAHARGIEVHAWYGVGPTYHDVYRDLTPPPGWMHTTHGIVAPVEQRWVTRTRDGTWSTYLDPGVPEVQAHVRAVVRELAANYDLDGIHLDYVRYESADHGYNPKAIAAFRAENPGASTLPATNDPVWNTWRRQQTRRIIQQAGAAIDAAGSDAMLSAAVISWADGPATPDRAGFQRTLSYTRVLQDWDLWVRNGEIDAVMPMNYFRAHDATQARQFASWLAYERALARDVAAQIVPGPAGYLNHPSNVLSQTRAAMTVDGATIYSYQQPTLDGSRGVWSQLASTRWGYAPTR
jgi:uncharacterized lipoprotein YddW (UPF0748 family)